MKESMSLTTILQIVILFILLFTAIMALTINNSNAFGMKDEILNIIENKNGDIFALTENNDELIDEIKTAFADATYRTAGKCKTDCIPEKNSESCWKGYNREGRATSGSDAAICIRKVSVTSNLEKYLSDSYPDAKVSTDDFANGVYYQIEVFYQLELPIISQVYNFSTRGETKVMYSKK